jgi:hypothetical protein
MQVAEARALAEKLIEFLETNQPPSGLFAPDVFLDFTLPRWRIQARGVARLIEIRREAGHSRGRVPRWRCDPTPTGFVLESEERWHHAGQDWYAREMSRADVEAGVITAISVYCTGDWDAAREAEHARCVRLLRP